MAAEAPQADAKFEDRIREHFETLDLSKARVLCVTTEYDNDAMWANYAENHTGCVLGFKHIEELSTPLLVAQPVKYSEERPIVGSGLDFLLYGDSSELGRRTLEAVCFTKKIGWSYESEWRVLTWRPNEHDLKHGDYRFYPEELESITLGARTSPATEAKVRQLMLAKYPSAILYRVALKNGETVRTKVSQTGGDV